MQGRRRVGSHWCTCFHHPPLLIDPILHSRMAEILIFHNPTTNMNRAPPVAIFRSVLFARLAGAFSLSCSRTIFHPLKLRLHGAGGQRELLVGPCIRASRQGGMSLSSSQHLVIVDLRRGEDQILSSSKSIGKDLYIGRYRRRESS